MSLTCATAQVSDIFEKTEIKKLSKNVRGEIILNGEKISYIKKKNVRAKKIKITIKADGSFLVTLPKRVPYRLADKFIDQKSEWIYKNVHRLKKDKIYFNKNKKNSVLEYKNKKEKARELITKKVMYFNSFLNFKYNSIRIKNQKTQWGSCSTKNNLNFNYKIFFLPAEVQDYIIVHELCHLKEFNHSKKFHELIESLIPNHKIIEKKLRKYSI